ncbi:MAG: type II secretion system protein GspC [Pseudomonadota bacterium]
MNAADLLDNSGLSGLAKHPLVSRSIQSAPTIVAAILVAILAWQIAGFIWSLFPKAEEQDIAVTYATQTANTEANTQATNVSVRPIIDAHLFGEAAPDEVVETTAAQQIDTVDAPETDLPLELRGTLASDDAEEALAIIADGRDEKVFRIDDAVRRGVTLAAVQPQQVLLRRNGALEALKLPVPDETAATRPQVRRPAPRTVSATQRPSTMSQVITSNAPALQEIISPRPYYVSGQQRGFRLYPRKDRQKFAALGLRPGDIVTEINGMPLTNAQQAAQVFSQLGSAQSVTVMLERNGQPQSLTLDPSQIQDVAQADE